MDELPFSFGVIASSDTHNASSTGYEDDYWGALGMMDAEGALRGSLPASTAEDGSNVYRSGYARITWGAAGLAGVWAERNTRDSIYAAMRRKETFGTSGTRIKVRLFGHLEHVERQSTADLPAGLLVFGFLEGCRASHVRCPRCRRKPV